MYRRVRHIIWTIKILISFIPAVAGAQDLSTLGTEKPFSVNGALTLQGQHFHSSAGMPSGRPEATGFLYLTPTVSIYGVQFPFSVYLTTNETTFRQPFNEYGVSPRYKWITGHFGYRSVMYSSYSLAFQRWLGAGVDVRTGWLRLSGMYGRFQAATDEDSSRGAAGIYRRMGYAAKVGFGSDQNYFDVNLLHAWDDSASIRRYSRVRTPAAAENAVLSLSGRVGLFDNRLSLEGEVAGSAYTRDISTSVENAQGVPDFFSALMKIRTATHANLAMRTALTYGMQSFRISLRYERVEPDFQSMGVGYISGDREDITIAPQAVLLRTVRLSASIGIRRNNLLGDRLSTTHRLITSLGGSWQATQDFGFDARYSNYSTSSSDGRVRVTDTTRIENVSEMYTLSPRYVFGSGESRQSVSLLLMRQQYDDRNLITGALNNNQSSTGTVSYTGMVSETGVNASLTLAKSRSTSYSNSTWSVSTGGTRTFLENALSLTLSIAYSVVQTAGGHDAQFLPGVTGSYRMSARDAFSFSSQLSQNARQVNPTTEIITSASYTRTF